WLEAIGWRVARGGDPAGHARGRAAELRRGRSGPAAGRCAGAREPAASGGRAGRRLPQAHAVRRRGRWFKAMAHDTGEAPAEAHVPQLQVGTGGSLTAADRTSRAAAPRPASVLQAEDPAGWHGPGEALERQRPDLLHLGDV